MLSRLIVIVVQLAAGWYGGLAVMQHLPDIGRLNLFMAAVVIALIVTLVGAVAAIVLKGAARPSTETFIFSLAVAVIVTVVTLVPDAERAIVAAVGPVPHFAYPLIGAVTGYAIHR